jgi:dihydroflavonol-4-reductase
LKVLVTGATGFLGANLVRRLLERGDEVICVIRKPNVCIEGLGVQIIKAPLLDRADAVEALSRAMDGCEGVYHLAGIFDPGPGGRERMFGLHVFGTRALLRAAEKAGVRRFLLCSSSVTVGFGGLDALGTEDSRMDPSVYGAGGPLQHYYRSKLQAEGLVLGWRGMETLVVNPDYIIGPWDVKPTSGQLILSMARNPLPFFPTGGKCFLGAEDCSDAHIAAMEKGSPGQRYLLGHENLSYLEFMSQIAEVIGCRRPMLPVPDTLMSLGGRAGRFAARFDPHRFAGLDPDVLRSMQQVRYRSGEKMQRDLSISPRPIHQSIEAAYRWFREHGYC